MTIKKVKKVRSGKIPKHHHEQHLRAIQLGEGIPPIPEMAEELDYMVDVLLGRKEPPMRNGLLTLYEIADAYYARAAEMTMLLQRAEREGNIVRGSGAVKFRTGELRTFMEMCKRAADLGSRRITHEALLLEAEKRGSDSTWSPGYRSGGSYDDED